MSRSHGARRHSDTRDHSSFSLFHITSFILNIRALTDARQHNDFINNSAPLTSLSKALFTSFLRTGVHYFLQTDDSLSNKQAQLVYRRHARRCVIHPDSISHITKDRSLLCAFGCLGSAARLGWLKPPLQ